LQLSPEKTCITHIEDGFDFLGQNLRRHDRKVLTTPSKKNMHAFFEKVRGAIKRNSTAKQANLIGILNPIIRGRANYHRHIVSVSVPESGDGHLAFSLALGKASSLEEADCLDRK